jgi:hypothetical protein
LTSIIGKEYPINPKSELFYLHRRKTITFYSIDWQTQQIEETTGKGLKKLIEKGVGFHGE